MILIYGKGKVGTAIAELCEYKGIAYEIKDDSDNLTVFDQYEAIVPSPGIPEHHRIYQTGKIVAELDFAYQFLPKGFRVVSVTGTDGKSTTSWIMYSILEKEYSVKKPVYISGNFDVPFSATILQILQKGETEGYIVVEVSSFMSYAIKAFQSDYSIFTNFKGDHLNWHTDLQDYLDAKMNTCVCTTKKCILNQQVCDFAGENGIKLNPPENLRIYANTTSSEYADRVDGDNIIIAERVEYKLRETQFSGSHNAMNILAATLVASEMNIPEKNIRIYLREIRGLPHRLEIVGEKQGVTIVEDSKSTSSQSLQAALSSFGTEKNLLLIVGGSDKGDSFDFLAPDFRKRVKAMACIGATKRHFDQIAQAENIPYISTDSLSESVDFLYQKGNPGDVLMLSPGCASFGLFRDYFDRANQFRSLIEKLPD